LIGTNAVKNSGDRGGACFSPNPDPSRSQAELFGNLSRHRGRHVAHWIPGHKGMTAGRTGLQRLKLLKSMAAEKEAAQGYALGCASLFLQLLEPQLAFA
jgi:hypothetical protein